MQSETALTARLIKSWRAMNAYVLNIHGHAGQAPGFPDCFVCARSWAGWIEFKGPKTPLQKHQERILKALSVHEKVFIVRFVEQSGNVWSFDITEVRTLTKINLIFAGTDGQVAASLLRELAGI